MKRFIITSVLVLLGLLGVTPSASAFTNHCGSVIDTTNDRRLSSPMLQTAIDQFETITGTRLFVRGDDGPYDVLGQEIYLLGLQANCPDIGIETYQPTGEPLMPQDTTLIVFQQDVDGKYYGSISVTSSKDEAVTYERLQPALDEFMNLSTGGDTEEAAILSYIAKALPVLV